MAKCPISGIDCSDCGYYDGCALEKIIDALEGIAMSIREASE